jgi:uncharacterized Zn finger protein (UPF0148 family)
MTTQTKRYVLHACPRCQGDLFPDDEGQFVCLQCARHVMLKEAPVEVPGATREPRDGPRREVTHAAA